MIEMVVVVVVDSVVLITSPFAEGWVRKGGGGGRGGRGGGVEDCLEVHGCFCESLCALYCSSIEYEWEKERHI